MRTASLMLPRRLALLMLLAAATAFASSANSATRLRLRCTVTPRTLPQAGGPITVHVDAGSQSVAALLVTLLRPDRTADTQPMTSLGDGEFEVVFQLPENTGRTVQKYTLAAFARGEDPAGAVASCGTVRVKGDTDAAPFAVSACRITPRALPAAGGSVHVEALITGKRKGLQVKALVVGNGAGPAVELTAGAGGIFQGDLTLPANPGGTQLNYNVHVVAELTSSTEITGMDCGFVAVAPADTSAQVSTIAVAGEIGGAPEIRTFDSATLDPLDNLLPFGRVFQGTATVAAADLDGDGVTDLISASGPGGPPQVRVNRGGDNQEIRSFVAYDTAFAGGVYVAAGDVNGDGIADVITGAGPGSTGGHVKVFSGRDGALLSSFLAYAPSFTGGVRVAVGDVNGDGRADLITGTGSGVASHVKVFSGADGSLLRSFFAFGTTFTGGVFVAAGDIDGDGRADIVTGAGGGAGGPHVKVFSGQSGSLLHDFFAYDAAFAGGVRVATGDVNGDGHVDVVTGAGAGSAGGHVKVFDGATGATLRSFLAYDAGFTGGVYVAAWN